MTNDSIYARLAARFDKHHRDPRGMEYVTGEQVVSRLNEVLGPGAWSFTIKDYGFNEESDEMWVLGHFEARMGEDHFAMVREQFGSQKHNRLRNNGKIIDHGFDLKGATTDALKKCASLIGVGLYLAEREGGIVQEQAYTPVKDQSPKADRDMVRSENDPLWQSWLKLTLSASRRGVDVPELRLPVDRNELKEVGKQLRDSLLPLAAAG